MALSNIFNEPKKELTETAVGVVALGVPLLSAFGLLYGLGWCLSSSKKLGDIIGAGILALVVVAAVLIIGVLILGAVHLIGEEIVNNWKRDHH